MWSSKNGFQLETQFVNEGILKFIFGSSSITTQLLSVVCSLTTSLCLVVYLLTSHLDLRPRFAASMFVFMLINFIIPYFVYEYNERGMSQCFQPSALNGEIEIHDRPIWIGMVPHNVQKKMRRSNSRRGLVIQHQK